MPDLSGQWDNRYPLIIMNQNSPQDIARFLLRSHREFGVDEAISEEPTNWFEKTDLPTKLPVKIGGKAINTGPVQDVTGREQIARRRSTPAPLSVDQAVGTARSVAAACKTLEELNDAIHNFDGCALKKTAKSTCIARGNPASKLVFIGEAPGRDEDMQGVPFVGRAGQLLDKMLASINLDESSVYITNIVFWRPPGNRTPSVQEAQTCLPFTERQIELIQPHFIVLLGGAAAKLMYRTNEGIMRVRGKWKSCAINESSYPAIATLHPAYLLRTTSAKRLAWRDLLTIRDKIDSRGTKE
ncbi:MAG: uracil-DNA glycosylase [Methyloligellaceae bacterium]